MEVDFFDTPRWDDLFERREIGRTKIARQARIFLTAQQGPIECSVRDITSLGAGIRADGLNILPVNFELSFDNFHTIRECRLIWRDGDFLVVVDGSGAPQHRNPSQAHLAPAPSRRP